MTIKHAPFSLGLLFFHRLKGVNKGDILIAKNLIKQIFSFLPLKRLKMCCTIIIINNTGYGTLQTVTLNIFVLHFSPCRHRQKTPASNLI